MCSAKLKTGTAIVKLMKTPSAVITDTLKKTRPNSSHSHEHIKLGKTFNSFTDVTRAICKYESINKFRLTQKYFRRIAANPKPSNKEDFMLSEEERKRLVYRWVDFCCTYFDEIHAHPPMEDANAEAIQTFKFTAKECPMRIRFQMRFKEKDLVVSIFREEHAQGSSMVNGIALTSPNPNLIKLTADICGVDQLAVALAIKHERRYDESTFTGSSILPIACPKSLSSSSFTHHNKCSSSHKRKQEESSMTNVSPKSNVSSKLSQSTFTRQSNMLQNSPPDNEGITNATFEEVVIKLEPMDFYGYEYEGDDSDDTNTA